MLAVVSAREVVLCGAPLLVFHLAISCRWYLLRSCLGSVLVLAAGVGTGTVGLGVGVLGYVLGLGYMGWGNLLVLAMVLVCDGAVYAQNKPNLRARLGSFT